jgi:hypothetical protein
VFFDEKDTWHEAKANEARDFHFMPMLFDHRRIVLMGTGFLQYYGLILRDVNGVGQYVRIGMFALEHKARTMVDL